MKVKSESEVPQSCPTLSDPMDCSLPGSSIHWIFQARVLEWGAIAFCTSEGIVPLKIPSSAGLLFVASVSEKLLELWVLSLSEQPLVPNAD